MGVGGLALGTVLAQYTAVLLLALGGLRYEGRILRHLSREYLWHPETLVRYFHVGKYLLIRTLLLQAVMLSFIRYVGAIGVTRLAANSLLMQLFTLFSYFMDGLAYAAEALVGEAIGGRRYGMLRLIVRVTLQVASPFAFVTSILYALSPPFLELLTDKQEVLELALSQSYLMAAVADRLLSRLPLGRHLSRCDGQQEHEHRGRWRCDDVLHHCGDHRHHR